MINGNLKSTYAADEQVLDNPNKKTAVAIMMILAACIGLFGSDYMILVSCLIGIWLIAVVGVNVVVGYTGLLSLGHAGFVAVGAFGVTIFHNLLTDIGFPDYLQPFVAIPAAMTLAALIGIVVGLPSLRVKGVYLAVATLSANFIIIFLIESALFASWTGGKHGLTTVDPNFLGWVVDTRREAFFLIAVLVFVTVFMIQNLFRTRIGRAFIAIRERDYSAEILGVSLLRYKLTSFAISAAVCGLAGAMFAYNDPKLLPETFTLAMSLQLVAALIVGGMGRTMGPFYGVLVIVLAPELLTIILSTFAGTSVDALLIRAPLKEIVFGLLLIGFIMFEPLGISRISERLYKNLNTWPFARGR